MATEGSSRPESSTDPSVTTLDAKTRKVIEFILRHPHESENVKQAIGAVLDRLATLEKPSQSENQTRVTQGPPSIGYEGLHRIISDQQHEISALRIKLAQAERERDIANDQLRLTLQDCGKAEARIAELERQLK